MGVFDHLAGAPTIAKLVSAPGGHVFGTFKPNLPITPLWEASGNCRYGFTEVYNGYVRGPEGTSFDQFQESVRNGQIPGVPADAALTPNDYYDAMYIAAGNTSIYDLYVKPVAAPAAGPDDGAAQAAHIAALEAQVAKLTAANGKAASIAQKALDALPTRGGGQWVNADRSTYPAILAALAPVLLLCVLLLSSGCAANKAVVTAAGGQVVGAAALVRCADIATKDPTQVPMLTMALDRAQAEINAGSPLLSLFDVGGNGLVLSPQTRSALAVVNVILEQKMLAFMAAAQAAVSNCRMGILSAGPVKP